MTQHLVIDIETVVDRELYTPSGATYSCEADAHTPACPFRAVGTTPGRSAPPVCTCAAPFTAARSFPPIYAHRPIVIGVLWLVDYKPKRLGIVAEGKDEAEMLRDFVNFIALVKPGIVGWNSRSFDLPVLSLRCLVHGIPSAHLHSENARKRFGGDSVDLVEVLGNYGAVRGGLPLDAVARSCGLPGKSGGPSGDQVEQLFAAGELEAIRRYCCSDVMQTALLFLRTQLLRGRLDVEQYRAHTGELLELAMNTERLGEEFVGRINKEKLLLAAAPTVAPALEVQR